MNTTDTIREKYAAVARGSLSTNDAGVRSVAEAFGYRAEELTAIPAEANMGLSCGNPVAVANLREGETVVDLGCGGGIDVFLASAKVGPTGRAIGIDMTPDMIDRAKQNALRGRDGRPFENVEFHLATIDALPLADASVDCVISNCVINLASDKPAVFREIARVLKPGGRLAISDIALKRELPTEIAADVMAFVGCIAGALLIVDYEQQLKAAGFTAVEIVDARADLNAYAAVEGQTGCCSPSMSSSSNMSSSSTNLLPGASCCDPSSERGIHGDLADLLSRYDINEYAASVKIFAVRP